MKTEEEDLFTNIVKDSELVTLESYHRTETIHK